MIIFVQSKERADELFHALVYDGINVGVIHADRTQAQRDATVEKFRTGEIWVLITTELMSRGMDFKAVNLVINFDFPQSVTSYIHRIGNSIPLSLLMREQVEQDELAGKVKQLLFTQMRTFHN